MGPHKAVVCFFACLLLLLFPVSRELYVLLNIPVTYSVVCSFGSWVESLLNATDVNAS